jgi:hypothetical protein
MSLSLVPVRLELSFSLDLSVFGALSSSCVLDSQLLSKKNYEISLKINKELEACEKFIK